MLTFLFDANLLPIIGTVQSRPMSTPDLTLLEGIISLPIRLLANTLVAMKMKSQQIDTSIRDSKASNLPVRTLPKEQGDTLLQVIEITNSCK